MGVGRIFSRGEGTRVFFQNSSRGAQKWWNCFFPLETRKTTFFDEIFKIQWDFRPPPLSDAHAWNQFPSVQLKFSEPFCAQTIWIQLLYLSLHNQKRLSTSVVLNLSVAVDLFHCTQNACGTLHFIELDLELQSRPSEEGLASPGFGNLTFSY